MQDSKFDSTSKLLTTLYLETIIRTLCLSYIQHCAFFFGFFKDGKLTSRIPSYNCKRKLKFIIIKKNEKYSIYKELEVKKCFLLWQP